MSRLQVLTITFCLFLSLVGVNSFAQAKKPTIMVMPSEAWCVEHNYVDIHDNMGETEQTPDYRLALQSDKHLNNVIAAVNTLMADRGFPLKDLQQTMRSIQSSSVEDALIRSSSTGNNILETPLDRIRRVARADIILEVDWTLNVTGPKYSISYIIRALDAYTNKQVAGSQGTGPQSFSANIAVMLEEAVNDNIDSFCSQLTAFFENMLVNGREIAFDVSLFDNGGTGSLDDVYNGITLSEIIEDFVAQNTVEHCFSLSDATESHMQFEQVMIPLYKVNGLAQDAYGFGRELMNHLRTVHKIKSKLYNRGLGRFLLVIGE